MVSLPPNFKSLDPTKPIEIYRRNLPHWRQDGATYAVTFHQFDALPKKRIEELKRLRQHWMQNNPEPRSEELWDTYASTFTHRVNAWLDEGHGSSAFSHKESVQILGKALTRFHNIRYHTGAYAIMPNHCHMIIRPFTGERLESLLNAIKGYVAYEVGKQLGTSGSKLWMEESYDRIIRTGEHLEKAFAYLGDNPRKAGLGGQQDWRCWVAEDWLEAGWVIT